MLGGFVVFVVFIAKFVGPKPVIPFEPFQNGDVADFFDVAGELFRHPLAV